MSQRHKWGLYLPNDGDPRVHDAIDVVGDGCYTLLHHQAGNDQCLKKLRAACPDALILIRCYVKDWYARDPVDWADEVYDILRGGGDPITRYTRHFTWANEQNLALESGGLVGASDTRLAAWRDYINIAAWNDAFLDRYRSLPGTDDDVAHYPAMAYGHGEDWGYDGDGHPLPGFPLDDGGVPVPAFELLRPGIDRCPVLNVHPYRQAGVPVLDEWRGVRRLELVEALFPGKPLFAAETGTFEITRPQAPGWMCDIGYYLQGRGSVVGFTPFIFDSPDPGHNANNWRLNPNVADAYKRTVRIPLNEPHYRWPTASGAPPNPAPAPEPPVPPTPDEPQAHVPMIHGIDISNNNGHVDLSAAHAAGKADFVVLKVSEDLPGTPDFYDSYAWDNLQQARALGIPVGFYHFVRPSVSTVVESVNALQTAMGHLGGMLAGEWIVLDCEDERFTGDLSVWFAEALALASLVFGHDVWKYSADWYTSTRNLEHASYGRYPTWWASYQASLPVPQEGWAPIRMWQYDVTVPGAVPGVAGRCDVNWFFGTADELRALGSPLGWVAPQEWSPPFPVPPVSTPPAPLPADPVTDALNNLWSMTLEEGPFTEERRVSAQRAIVTVKAALGRE